MSNVVLSRWMFGRLLGLAIYLAISTGTFTSEAATSLVQIVNYLFLPSNSVLNAGESITWTNVSGIAHDSTHNATPRLWQSGDILNAKSYTFTFTNSGVYPYFCFQHRVLRPEQRGNVTVNAANTPPSVTLTNPPNNTHFFAPATIVLRASASDSDGSIGNVLFYSDATLLGSDSTSPYSLTNVMSQGVYQLTAVAIDNQGARATSSVVNVSVDATPAIVLQNPEWRTDKKFAFRISGGATGQRAEIQAAGTPAGLVTIATTNFPNTVCPICPVIDFVDPASPPTARFYKVLVSPQ